MAWPSGAHIHHFIPWNRGGIFHVNLVKISILSLTTHLHPSSAVAGEIWTPHRTALLIDIPGESGSDGMAIWGTHLSFYTME